MKTKKAQEVIMLLLFQVKHLRLQEYGLSEYWKFGVIHNFGTPVHWPFFLSLVSEFGKIKQQVS